MPTSKTRLFFSQLSLALLLSAAALTVQAADAPAEYAGCVACHGASGEGNPAFNAPALAGQDAGYLTRQLQHFKSGLRGADPKDTGGAQMRPMAALLADDQAIGKVATYLAALPAASPGAAPATADLRNGNNHYQATCGACHGGRAEGNPAMNAPRLNHLSASYLKQQFQNYQQGIRGNHPDDRYGKQMAMMARSLPSEKTLDDVIAFIHAKFE